MLVERGSPGFESFLEILGERIRLKGWDKYRGGLDVKGTLMIWILVVQTRDLQSEKVCNRHSSLQIVTLAGFENVLPFLQFFQLTNRLITIFFSDRNNTFTEDILKY